jgi:hypothetical protein
MSDTLVCPALLLLLLLLLVCRALLLWGLALGLGAGSDPPAAF